MNNKQISSYIVFISIFTFITIFTIIAHNSYNNLVKPSEIVSTTDSIKPLNTNLDFSVLEEIESREELSIEDLNMGLQQQEEGFETEYATQSVTPQ